LLCVPELEMEAEPELLSPEMELVMIDRMWRGVG
jgi:hypothetical protein